MTEQSAERPLCPSCDAVMTRIAYGYPSARSFELAEQGEIVLGGCVVTPDSPVWARPLRRPHPSQTGHGRADSRVRPP
ncbi:hypothetical protein F3087_28035 [Nocardia colli]|uniref:Uncharacterized protein n=1 Tax=Nocardia colli TaxID=2545717 RepID=A0A5N0EAI9_9NOCA|nr:hypothetical protein F3087_28035 [Nocardia colli]